MSALLPVKEGVRLFVKVTPKSSRDRILGLVQDAEGQEVLRVAVSAPPDKGKANQALLKVLSRETGLARSTMTVISGAQSRRKTILIEGEPETLERKLSLWLEAI